MGNVTKPYEFYDPKACKGLYYSESKKKWIWCTIDPESLKPKISTVVNVKTETNAKTKFIPPMDEKSYILCICDYENNSIICRNRTYTTEFHNKINGVNICKNNCLYKYTITFVDIYPAHTLVYYVQKIDSKCDIFDY
jgi:hypothetical protein